MKRVFWTVGVGLAGLFIGGHSGGRVGLIIGLIWGACIGSGFWAIFSQTIPTKRLVVYWAVTLMLVGPFFGVVVYAAPRPYVSTAQLATAGVVGGLLGGLLGVLIGALQLSRLRRRLPSA
jgi:hypothetical protein